MENYEMLNNNILCKDVTTNKKETDSGFIDKKQTRFKELKVVLSDSSLIESGKIIKVRSTSGDTIELTEGSFIVISMRDVIMVL